MGLWRITSNNWRAGWRLLCKDAGEKIYIVENVEGIYIHVLENNAGKAFGYYHEKDRLSSTYLSPTSGKNYRFWEMDSFGKDGVINHHRIETYPLGKLGEPIIELKQVALPVAGYGITWRPLTGDEDQRQGLHGDELKIFNVQTEQILAVRTLFFYAITDTTVDASGETLQIQADTGCLVSPHALITIQALMIPILI